MEEIKQLKDLFKLEGKLTVPSYQRAYAWEEEQLNQFISDILEIKDKEGYYYGHFILERTKDDLAIIDGQQRLTTFILFLLVCKLFTDYGYADYLDKFVTVDYDKASFDLIREKLIDINIELKLEDLELNSEKTLSIKRILFALDYFRKLFVDKKLDRSKVDIYVSTLMNAHISTHIAYTKAIAVQIFELQNTRGVQLNLIEKVKSKLMKAVYIHSKIDQSDEIIAKIQKDFAEIYRLEETASSNAFRGELKLDDILLHHLRIVDDGAKLSASDKNIFNSPSKTGDKEKSILNYIDKQISEKTEQEIVGYITSLVENFKKSVELVSIHLFDKDRNNPLIGDVLILDKNISLEFFILLYHKNLELSIENINVVRLWEKLLFTRDFHDRYYRQWYRDDFERMFFEIASKNEEKELIQTLLTFLEKGFRNELMENGSLPLTVTQYIENNKDNILHNAFNWWQDKMVYLLYKYEIENHADFDKLRNVMKQGRSIEHILPQEWNWDWINEKEDSVSETGKKKQESLNRHINGVGNLLLITASENSSQSNKHPKDKHYQSCKGGSYDNHNKWDDYNKWESNISERGTSIYDFLIKFIK